MDSARVKRTAIKVAIVVLLLALVVPAIYTFGSLHVSYSKGERVGYVQKLSTRGWLCKTNEGELSMVNLPGQPAEKFPFTVRNDALVGKIDALAGHKVVLRYEEHRGVPTSCFGDTSYFVVDVRAAE